MIFGVIFGFTMLQFDGGAIFINNWIKPLGTIFVKLLKLIAIPLILASLIKGVSDLKDISKLASIGTKTIFIYLITTIIAITIGISLVNFFNPGDSVSDSTIYKLTEAYSDNNSLQTKISEATKQQKSGPLNFLVDIVPENAFSALSNNKLMLQVIFLAILVGISLLLIGQEKSKPFLTAT